MNILFLYSSGVEKRILFVNNCLLNSFLFLYSNTVGKKDNVCE